MKLGEDERNATQKEWEEKEFRAEVLRNRRSSDVKARWNASSWRAMGFKEDTIEELLCESLCCPSDSDNSDGMAVDTSRSPEPTPEPERPKTPPGEDSEWGRSSLGDSPETQ